MAYYSSQRINSNVVPRLRVGIKWNPLERDDISELYGIDSAEDAFQAKRGASVEAKVLKAILGFFKLSHLMQNKFAKFDNARAYDLQKKEQMGNYLDQKNESSFDLDLCCLCYGRDARFMKMITGNTIESYGASPDDRMAIIHSGNDLTGTGNAFDEELQVDLSIMGKDVGQIFFVVHSANHGFNEINGGFWAISSTSDEKELLASPLLSNGNQRIHVMARLVRDGTVGGWSLDRIAEFAYLEDYGDEDMPTEERIDKLISDKFLAR